MSHTDQYARLQEEVDRHNATLVAVSKTKSEADILDLYQKGQRDFGENYVQELVAKQAALPQDIQWHFIGHLQRNKVKMIAPFVHLIHSVDSLKLLAEIDKEAKKNARTIDILLQVYVGSEETKFGLDETEVYRFCEDWENQKATLQNVRIRGLMGMASLTEDQIQIKNEFKKLVEIFEVLRTRFFLDQSSFDTKSLGMSGDYTLALEAGSTMLRIGSMLFGSRQK